MNAPGNDATMDFDADQASAELDDLQRRLDALAGQGTNPYEIKRLQAALNTARAELLALFPSPRSVVV